MMEHLSAELTAARLGLPRGTVDLRASSEAWGAAYTAIEPELRSACGRHALDIQHVGSTSVPGLRAKPILDVVVGVRPDVAVPDELVDSLVRTGFIDRGAGEGSVGRLLVWDAAPQVRAIHLHIVGHATQGWKDYVDFRDALRADPDLLTRYEQVKDDLARRFPDDRGAYTDGKAEFVEGVLHRLPGP